MREVDIAIVGGGLAGSTAAAMLGQRGVPSVLIDPHPAYPADFRCEKFDASQVQLLKATGLANAVLRQTAPVDEISVGAFGRVIERRPGDQYGFAYTTLVNTVREQVAGNTEFISAKATDIRLNPERQTVTLSNGEQISARLVVLANGLNSGLRQRLGIAREDLSQCHSIGIGFDLRPTDRFKFPFSAFTYYPERVADRVAYLSLFPIGATMRANLFVYRDMRDPWLREMRETPWEALSTLMPGVRSLIGPFAATSFVQIRPVDLYTVSGHRRDGIVLVGDAFATSCPAAGTGANKVLTDVERLCNVHIPRWLADGGMGEEKIAAFYDDPVKKASDSHSIAKAFYLRSLSTETAPMWRARWWSRYLRQFARGAVRSARERVPIGRPNRARTATSGSSGP